MWGLVSQTPRVLRDDADELVIEESHLGRWTLLAAALVFSSGFLVPAVTSGDPVKFVIGLVLAGVVVGLPFLTVLAASSYRRLTVRAGREVIAERVYRLWPARVTRTPWEEIERVTCQRVRGRGRLLAPNPVDVSLGLGGALRTDDRPGHRTPDRLVVKGIFRDGSQHTLLQGWHADALATALRQRFSDKVVAAG